MGLVHEAVKSGSLEQVQLSLQAGADLEEHEEVSKPLVPYKTRVTALWLASALGNDSIVKLLVQNGANIDAKDSLLGYTPLTIATIREHIETVNILLAENADVNARDSSIWIATVLYKAAAGGREAMVEILVENGADLEGGEKRCGNTPLIGAAKYGKTRSMEILVQSGADVEARNKEGATALWIAASEGQENAVKLLVGLKADVDARDSELGITPFMVAAQEGWVNTVSFLAKLTANIEARETKKITQDHPGGVSAAMSVYGMTALHRAVVREHESVVMKLLEVGVDVEAIDGNSGMTALVAAADKENINITQALLQHGADINHKDNIHWSALHFACKRRRLEMVVLLLEYKAHVDVKTVMNVTPLFLVAENGDVDIAKVLLDNGADVGATMKDGRAPIHAAASKGHCQILKMLIEKNADISLLAKDGLTPLQHAAIQNQWPAVKILVEEGEDICSRDSEGRSLLMMTCQANFDVFPCSEDYLNLQDHAGRTALMWATGFKDYYKVAALLEHGADPDFCDLWRRSVLHIAAYIDARPILQLLMRHSITHLNSTDINGWTPLHLASRRALSGTIDHLVTAGADITVKDKYGRLPAQHLQYRYSHKDEIIQGDVMCNLEPWHMEDEMFQLLDTPALQLTPKYPHTADLVRTLRDPHSPANNNSGIALVKELFQAEGLGLIRADVTIVKVWTEVDLVVKRLVFSMNQRDTRLDMFYQYAGSTAEGTKVRIVDEIDIQLCLRALQGELRVNKEHGSRRVSVSIPHASTAFIWREFLSEGNTAKAEGNTAKG